MTPTEGRKREKCGGKVHPLVGLVAIAIPGSSGSLGQFSPVLCPRLCSLLLTVTPKPQKLQTSGLILCCLLLWV